VSRPRRPLPKWSDEETVAKLVAQEIDDADAHEEYEFWTYYQTQDQPPAVPSDVIALMERRAIAAAEDGDFYPLGRMILNPLFKQFGGGVLSPQRRSTHSRK
jgi:hypothetical protein